MKYPFLMSLLLTSSAFAKPTDLVIYDEAAAQNTLVSIQKDANGVENLVRYSCDKDTWIGDSATQAAHCRDVMQIFPVSLFAEFVERTALNYEKEHPNTALQPLAAEDLMALVNSDRIQNDPGLISAAQKITDLNTDLTGVEKMLAHLPDNPTYRDRKAADLAAISGLSQQNQQLQKSKDIQKRVKTEIAQLSESMLNLIRHKKLKNPNLALSAANPETDEPNSFGKSQMQGTLLKAVLEKFGSSSEGAADTHFKGERYTTTIDGSGTATLVSDAIVSTKIDSSVSSLLLFASSQNLYAVYLYKNSGVYFWTLGGSYKGVTADAAGYVLIESASLVGNNVTLVARKADGTRWKQTYDVTQLVLNDNWTQIKN